jgi:putative transposase
VTSTLAKTIFSILCFITGARVVSVTNYPHPVPSFRHLERMEQIMREVCADFGCEPAELNGEHPARPG